MFATLDDLEGRVEMIIFAKTLESNEGLIDTDAVLLVRGRVDRKDRGEIKLVVFDAEPFEPSSDEVETAKERIRELAEPVRFPLHLDAAKYDSSIIEELKSVFSNFPGEAEVVLEMRTREGVRKLRFGSEYRVDASVGLRAEIEELLGQPPMAA
jgi:DNA polymerase-3 subunit alpha